MSLDGAPIYTRTMRLTNEQWAQTVTDVFGLKALPDAYQGFERAVAGTTDFSNNEHVLSVNGAQSESYQQAAEQIAQTVTSSAQSLAAVYVGTDANGFVRKLGRRLFRRPLTAQEEESYLSLFDRGAAMSGPGTSFAKGAGLVIRGLLQSPYFLYRTELGNVGAPLSGYEIAAKLSFLAARHDAQRGAARCRRRRHARHCRRRSAVGDKDAGATGSGCDHAAVSPRASPL